MLKHPVIVFFAGVAVLGLAAALPDYYPFDGQADNMEDVYYYTITGGIFPTGTIPNGDNASGGTFRFILDEPAWGGYALNVWNKDDWFPQNAGLALTILRGNTSLYDNNGLEDGSGADFYDNTGKPPYIPGLYRAYNMTNNWDWVYATYFKLDSPTTFDRLIGYFDGNGTVDGPFDPLSPTISYRMNIWTAANTGGTTWMPAVASFTGNAFCSDTIAGVFTPSYTGIDRIFPEVDGSSHDPIWRVEFQLAKSFTLPAGVYFFSHSAIVVMPLSIDIKPGDGPNSINLKNKGVVPVAILGTDDYDAEEIDSATLLFAGAKPDKVQVGDVNKDGFMDLILHVRTQDLLLGSGATSADVTGFMKDGTPVKGTDAVRIVR